MIIQAGPWFSVSGAVMHVHPIVEPLTDLLWSDERPTDNGSRYAEFTRLFMALRNAKETLQKYYAEIAAPSEALARSVLEDIGRSLFPYPKAFEYQGKRHSLRYIKQVAGKLAWIAEAEDNPQVLVKFTRQYARHCHELLELHGLAPKLYSAEACGRPDSFRMVVMDFISHPKDWTNVPDHGRLSVIKCIRRSLEILHEGGWVFGDLRSANILIVYEDKKDSAHSVTGRPDTENSENSQSWRGYLVDFDWCGRDGEDRFPAGLNPQVFDTLGIKSCDIMTKQHDLRALEQLEKVWTLVPG